MKTTDTKSSNHALGKVIKAIVDNAKLHVSRSLLAAKQSATATNIKSENTRRK